MRFGYRTQLISGRVLSASAEDGPPIRLRLDRSSEEPVMEERPIPSATSIQSKNEWILNEPHGLRNPLLGASHQQVEVRDYPAVSVDIQKTASVRSRSARQEVPQISRYLENRPPRDPSVGYVMPHSRAIMPPALPHAVLLSIPRERSRTEGGTGTEFSGIPWRMACMHESAPGSMGAELRGRAQAGRRWRAEQSGTPSRNWQY